MDPPSAITSPSTLDPTALSFPNPVWPTLLHAICLTDGGGWVSGWKLSWILRTKIRASIDVIYDLDLFPHQGCNRQQCLVGNPFKLWFATITRWRVDPTKWWFLNKSEKTSPALNLFSLSVGICQHQSTCRSANQALSLGQRFHKNFGGVLGSKISTCFSSFLHTVWIANPRKIY